MALLSAKATDLRNGHAMDTSFMKRIFDLMARFNGGLQNRAFIEIRPSA